MPRLALVILLNLVRLTYGDPFIFSLFGSQWNLRNENGTISLSNALLPGDIYEELWRQNVITNPLWRDNDVNLRWIAYDNWSFGRNFTVPPDLIRRHRFSLVLSRIDTFASVYINEILIGLTENQFRQYIWPLNESLLIEGVDTNRIELKFNSSVKTAAKLYADHISRKGYLVPPECTPPVQHGECHVNHIRSIQASFSWDWGPAM